MDGVEEENAELESQLSTFMAGETFSIVLTGDFQAYAQLDKFISKRSEVSARFAAKQFH
jgi:hypothetical protein